MKILIEYGIDIDAQGPYNGYTALHDAVWQNNIEGATRPKEYTLAQKDRP